MNRASSPDCSLQDNPSNWLWRPAPGLGHDIRREDWRPEGVQSPGDRLRAAPTVPASKVAAGLAIRRWQPGQSAEGNLQADGQYTNLSVRQ